MRITFVARAYPPARGGVEAFLQLLARALAERHEVSVLAQRVDAGESGRLTDSLRPPPAFEPFDDGRVLVKPFRLPAARRAMLLPLAYQVTPGLRRYAFGPSRVAAAALYSRVASPVLRRAVRGADIVHVFGGDLLKTAAIDLAVREKLPAVITPFAHPGQWADDPASARAYARATRVIALLESDAAVYARLGVALERIEVSGVCTAPLEDADGTAIRKRFGIEGPLVLFLGARRAYKGADIVVEAARRVAAMRPDVTFALVGPGGPLGVVGDPARVIDVGEVDDSEKAAWLRAADLLALPSAAEIFPLAVLEAWSCRVPVVTSDIPPLREITERSGGGVAVPRDPSAVADAVVGLLEDPARRRAMGEAGLLFWRAGHTPEAVAGWHERLYADLTAQPGLREPHPANA